MTTHSNTLTIGPRFFQLELQNYADARTAFARELVQNSLDAGCTQMRLKIDDGEDSSNILFQDNGKGMPRQVLTEKYLVMGETGNEGENSVGGFGKARVLTCFAAKSYSIISSDYILSGSGANYEIKDNGVSSGCTLHIEQPKKDWAQYFRYVIDRSSLYRSTFYINGEQYFSKMANKGRLVRMLSFGAVFANKSIKSKKLIVRVNGIFMFERDIEANAQVVVEIDPATSREVLLSNRDSLVWEKQKELDAFLNELASDTNSALRDKTRRFSRVFNKGMCFSVNKAKKAEVSHSEAGQNIQILTENIGVPQVSSQNAEFNPGIAQNTEINHPQNDPVVQSMLILNESNDPKKVALINNFYSAEKWENKNSTRYQLLKIWAAINAIVAEELSSLINAEVNYSNGWVFTDDEDRAEAMCSKIDGISYILLNPIDKDNKLKYSVNSVDDYFELMVLSAHEFSHVVHNFHQEGFSSLFTVLMQKVMGRRKEIVNAAKESK